MTHRIVAGGNVVEQFDAGPLSPNMKRPEPEVQRGIDSGNVIKGRAPVRAEVLRIHKNQQWHIIGRPKMKKLSKVVFRTARINLDITLACSETLVELMSENI